jgi:hypothetical protein
MKLNFLLFLTLLSFILKAQEPNRSLIITEARFETQPDMYLELTNRGDTDINLSEYKLGLLQWWSGNGIFDPYGSWSMDPNLTIMLPEVMLKPGESWVITTAYDFWNRMYRLGYEDFTERYKQEDIYEIADFLVHVPESRSDVFPNVKDSVTTYPGGDIYNITNVWNGNGCYFIEHHFAEGDSVVVDQVGGVFDVAGRNRSSGAYSVAGVEGATNNSILVRKFSIKSGNPDFNSARGVAIEDSEWIPIQRPNRDPWRDTWWTVGNDGPYILDENTLESDVIDVDFANKTLTVPWGIRRLDGIMHNMVKKPGIAWRYHLNPNQADSLYRSVRTGDKLTVYVCGNELQSATFDIIVAEPTADANIVVPIDSKNPRGPVTNREQNGILTWPRITQHESGIDTITGQNFGLAFATRVDTLFKYVEKPANATMEIVWVDGVMRPDLKDGDILKVTAQNGEIKEYFIQVQPYKPSHNAYLSCITWPDMPNSYKDMSEILGWKGDTIPGFNRTTFNYTIKLPADFSGIPALVAKAEQLNSKIKVKRATSLSGPPEEATISFTVTAEDDSVNATYNVRLEKEKDIANIQPYFAEPFLSEIIEWDINANSFGEICNPGNQPLDLSNYMIVQAYNANPAEIIESTMGEDQWPVRYNKYVPGYKWVGEGRWIIDPGRLEPDLNVNPIVQPGDVFCFGAIRNDNGMGGHAPYLTNYDWPVPKNLDVQFLNTIGNYGAEYKNPWNEEVQVGGTPINKLTNSCWFMFKIKNDSILNGTKPANDPNDFELIEAFGMSDVSTWVIGGREAHWIMNFSRKPHIYEGNTVLEGSFGTNPDDSEWTWTNMAYWAERGMNYYHQYLSIGNDLGQHYMNEPTHYQSTVTSVVYKVSEGYSMDEEIRGMTPGTTVGTFLSNLVKANENQSLTVMSGDAQLGMDDLLSLDDVLIVLSADSTNTSQYILDVNEEGLSSNALLTSTLYDVVIENEPKSASAIAEDGAGYITGFEYGTQLRTVLNNVTVPDGATLSIVNDSGAYVSLRRLNFDTAYVNVTVNANTYFDVVAENGVTRIVYQLQPRSSENDAFILSDVYAVLQSENLVNFVPRGTNVQAFLTNVVPSLGATVKVVDKMGFERTEGSLYEDDKVVVTSPNGLITRVYHLSMLRTEFIPETTYLAYVLSNVYAVDQVDYTITGPTGSTLLSDFYARITPSIGATAVVVDTDGNEKTMGDLDDGDMLKVTSADGKIVVMYELKLDLTSVDLTGVSQIEIYPNPTSGKLNIRSAEPGNRVQVFNASGAMVREMKIQSNLEVLSIDDQPSGMYLIVISNDKQQIGRYKAIKN